MSRAVAIFAVVVALLVAVAVVFLFGRTQQTIVVTTRTTTIVAVADPAPPRAAAPRTGTTSPDAAAPAAEAEAPPAAPATVRIRVCDGDDETPLPGAEVVLAEDDDGTNARRATTDAAGAAEFGGLAARAWLVRVTAPGRVRSGWDWVQAKSGETRETDIVLDAGALLRGVALDAATRRPLASVRVVVVPGGAIDGMSSASSDPPYGDATTGEDGLFAVLVDAGEMATVHLRAAGRARASRTVVIPAGAAGPPLEFPMEPAGQIAGRVTDPDGAPVAGARVFAVPAGAEMLLQNPEGSVSSTGSGGRTTTAEKATTGADGRFEMDGVAFGGSYHVFARAEGHAQSAVHEGATVTPGAPSVSVDLELRRPGALVLRVTGPDGKGVAARVQVSTDLAWPRQHETDASGVLRLAPCEPVRHTLEIRADGFPVQHAEADVAPGRDTEAAVRLEAGHAIEGVVLDDRGKPVASATVNAHRPHTPAARSLSRSDGTAKSDASGRFRIDGLRGGPHVLGGFAQFHAMAADVASDAPATGVVVVMRREARIRLRLAVPPGAEPPANVHVFAGHLADFSTPGNDLWGGSATTEDFREGAVEAWFEPGRSLLRVLAAGFARIERRFEAEPGAEIDLGTIALDPGTDLAGRVLDASGAPVASARVTFGEVFTPEEQSVAAGADGTFRLRHLAAGKVSFRVVAEGFLPLETSADAAPGGTPVVVRLARGALLRITVVDGDGRGVAEADLSVRPAADPEADAIEYPSADHRGVAQVRVPAGRWRVVAEGRNAWAECEAAEGGEAAVRIVVR